MKKIFLMLIIVIMVIPQLPVFAGNVAKEEFEEEKPFSDYNVVVSGGNAKIKKIPDGAKEVYALVLQDPYSVEGVTFMKSYDKITGSVSVEMKVRIEKMMTNLNIILGEGSTVLTQINIGVAGEITISDGSEFVKFNDTVAKLNNWISFKVAYYPEKNRIDARCNNEIKEKLKLHPDHSGNGFDKVIIKTGAGQPNVSLDFISVVTGKDVNADVTPITPLYTEPPVSHAVDGIINILYNGEYKFFDYQPVIRNSRVLIPFRRVFDMLGMEISYDEQTRTATGKNEAYEIKITVGSNKALVNGVENVLDVTPEIIENSFYVPVRFVSQTIGKDVDWDADTRTVIIND